MQIYRIARTFISVVALIALGIAPTSAWAWHFAEGFSSPAPGFHVNTGYRAFTTVTGPEACAISPTPAEFRFKPSGIDLTVGTRIYRSVLVIEAYDKEGNFLPSIPINVELIEADDLLASGSDWTYAEGVRPGKGKVVVSWRCPAEYPISATAEITVTAYPALSPGANPQQQDANQHHIVLGANGEITLDGTAVDSAQFDETVRAMSREERMAFQADPGVSDEELQALMERTLSIRGQTLGLSSGAKLPMLTRLPPTELMDACEGKEIEDNCSVFFGSRQREGRCIEGRQDAVICMPTDGPKSLPAELYEACETKQEKDACLAPLGGHKNPGHCNKHRDGRLLCLPGPWPWRS